jgi:hypothetical protein
MKILTILLISFLSVFALKLTKSGNYVIDDTHKLMWQDTKDNAYVQVIHDKAVAYCKNLNLDGFTDWYLPTVEQLKHTIDKKRRSNIKINKAFRHKTQFDYWASDRTWIRNFGLYGYYVKYKNGAAYYQNRTYKMFVRCVRDIK